MHRSQGQGQRKPDYSIQMLYTGEDDHELGKKYVKRRRIHKGRLFLLVLFFATIIYFFLPRSKVVVTSDAEQEERVPDLDVGEATREPVNDKGLPALTVLAEAEEEFAMDLYKALTKRSKAKNLFFSPLSLSIALAMTHLGARSQTATQMETALKFDKVGLENVHPMFHILNSELFNQEQSYILKSANKLFGHEKYKFLDDFLSSCEAYYGAALERVNYANAEAARSEINKWVEKQTEKKIKDLIPPGAIDGLTRLILVNAVYFKAKWALEFDPKQTKNADFFWDKTNKVSVPMMHLKQKFNYYADQTLKCKVLELPYSQSNLSMIAVLPDARDGIAALEEKTTSEQLQSWIKNLNKVEVEVSLPKFKLESGFSVKPALQELGMRDLFLEGVADLTGMTEPKELFVSDALHKAFIEVTEEGTEAAAASAVIVAIKSAMVAQPVFNANHPFIFLIRDNNTGVILFLGRVLHPLK
ncbi:leukocyte elastase inhibitor-like [Ptychodera flava]|uniref:leukocyte elastase inhibitor-like n=1 Tax=Ptychodera flava TaxID=63121 RepID=UPI00396A9891